MITLPIPPRRAWALSFWLTLSAAGGISVAVALGLWLGPSGAALGAASGAAMALSGFALPAIPPKGYRIWAEWANLVNALLRRAVTAAAFFTILVPLRWTGDDLRRSAPGTDRSQWGPLTAAGSGHSRALTAPVPDESWIRTYIAWTWRSGNLWAVSLLPYLVLLRVFREKDDRDAFSTIYTLF